MIWLFKSLKVVNPNLNPSPIKEFPKVGLSTRTEDLNSVSTCMEMVTFIRHTHAAGLWDGIWAATHSFSPKESLKTGDPLKLLCETNGGL